MKKIDPNYCFLLPDDLDSLVNAMEQGQGAGRTSSTRQFWIVKEDHRDKHLHGGKGIRFIESAHELPNSQEQSSGAYIVQPLVKHKMGVGDYKLRRHELKMYVGVTSTSPLRAYAYSMVGVFANAEINDANPLEPCSVDTHGVTDQIKLGCHINETFSSARSFDQFSDNIGISQTEKHLFLQRVHTLLGSILLHAQPMIQNHTVNQGITKSGAACFSFLRVDFAMSETIEPYIYEINEFPFANVKGFQGNVQENAYRELFKMMGLNRPPMHASERGNYEMANLGAWTPLVFDDNIQ
jgi:hypothetical protein